MGIQCCEGEIRKEPEVYKETSLEIAEEAEIPLTAKGKHQLSQASISTQASLTSPTTVKKEREKKVSFALIDGSTYNGEWLDGMRDGKGKHKMDSGLQYTGEWLLDKRHGFGKQQFDNGDVYFGQWENDL